VVQRCRFRNLSKATKECGLCRLAPPYVDTLCVVTSECSQANMSESMESFLQIEVAKFIVCQQDYVSKQLCIDGISRIDG
jgi:hypothetical protein